MKTALTFTVLMLSSILLYSAPAFNVHNVKPTTEESSSVSNATEMPVLNEKSKNSGIYDNKNESEQCSFNSRMELRGRLILEKKYKLYT